MAVLAANVAMRNPETGAVEVFVSGAVPPDWVAEAISNPDLWQADEDTSEAPPKAGKGSGRQAWVAYAEAQGLGVDEDMSRDDIIERIEG